MKLTGPAVKALGVVALLLMCGTWPSFGGWLGIGEKNALLGVYSGKPYKGLIMDDVKCMEEWQGKKYAVVNVFTSIDGPMIEDLFNRQLPSIWNNQNVPLISFEPRFWFEDTSNFMSRRIIKGEYDSTFKLWAQQLKAFLKGADDVYGTRDDRRAYMRFAQSMNGDWYPWSAKKEGDQPSDYVEMWRHVRALFQELDIDNTHMQWIWSVNHVDVGPFKAEEYFPGNDQVDWVGIDGYNWGEGKNNMKWRTPENLYGTMIRRLRQISKRPLAITCFASSTYRGLDENGETVAEIGAKSGWIAQTYAFFLKNKAKMVVWFNEEKEMDWCVFDGARGDEIVECGGERYRAYSAYRIAVNDVRLLPATEDNPRLLTDAQFAGRL